jgi:hypothetical protein
MIEAMVKAGIDPFYIYAFQKTGLIVTADNWDKLSPEGVGGELLIVPASIDSAKQYLAFAFQGKSTIASILKITTCKRSNLIYGNHSR